MRNHLPEEKVKHLRKNEKETFFYCNLLTRSKRGSTPFYDNVVRFFINKYIFNLKKNFHLILSELLGDLGKET